MIRVFLVDDQDLVRAGFRLLLQTQADVEVVGEAADGREALDALATTRADVVLMDVRMPRLDGVEATRELLRRDADAAPRVLVLTTYDADEHVFDALRAGAAGFLLKDAQPEALLGAIRAVAAGDAVVAPGPTRRLLERFAPLLPDNGAADRLAELTTREREVLVLIARGATNPEIGVQLHLSPGTVKTHVGRLLGKLGARDRVALVLLAYEAGLVR